MKDDKTRRAPSAYNQFMKDHLADYKEKHPDLNHKEAFSAVCIVIFFHHIRLLIRSFYDSFFSSFSPVGSPGR